MVRDDDVAHGWTIIKIPELQLIIYISIQGKKHPMIIFIEYKKCTKI